MNRHNGNYNPSQSQGHQHTQQDGQHATTQHHPSQPNSFAQNQAAHLAQKPATAQAQGPTGLQIGAQQQKAQQQQQQQPNKRQNVVGERMHKAITIAETEQQAANIQQQQQQQIVQKKWTPVQQLYAHQHGNIRYCHGMADDHLRDLLELENRRQTAIHPAYMASQHHISTRYREVLVDWLSSIRGRYNLKLDTFCLSINLMDRFLSVRLIEKPQLQLLGVTCLWIAAKYEEIYPPELDDLVVVADHNYTRTQICMFERIVVEVLQFQLTMAYPHQFAERMIEAIDFASYGVVQTEDEIVNARRTLLRITDFLLDSSHQHYCLVGTLPSRLAASAVVIALMWTGYCGTDYYPVIISKMCTHEYDFLHICVLTLWREVSRVQQEHFEKVRASLLRQQGDPDAPRIGKVFNSVYRHHQKLIPDLDTIARAYDESIVLQAKARYVPEPTEEEQQQQQQQ